MAQIHTLTYYEQPGNFPNFRHGVKCVCGFEGKVATKQHAESIGAGHLQHHGAMTETEKETELAQDMERGKHIHDNSGKVVVAENEQKIPGPLTPEVIKPILPVANAVNSINDDAASSGGIRKLGSV